MFSGLFSIAHRARALFLLLSRSRAWAWEPSGRCSLPPFSSTEFVGQRLELLEREVDVRCNMLACLRQLDGTGD
jgi:hypothetical protein